MNRRDFIKLGVASFLSVEAALFGHQFFKLDDQNESEITPELEQMLHEIIEFRNVFKLPPLPEKLSPDALKSYQEFEPQFAFENNLPEYLQSYGKRTDQLSRSVLGKYANKLIHGAEITNSFNSGANFDPQSRFVRLSANIRDYWAIDEGFTDVFLHEVGGHGTDPEISGSIYTKNDLIKIFHGKWKALTQARSIEGMFLLHEEDSILPRIKFEVGEIVAKSFIEDPTFRNNVSSGFTIFYEFIASKAKERNISSNELSFNKHICKDLGELALENILNGNVVLENDLLNQYAEIIEKSFLEVYAEMVKHSILNPDKLHNNSIVSDGITEVFSTLLEREVNLSEIRDQISVIPDNIQYLFNQEALVLSQEINSGLTITDEEQEHRDLVNKYFAEFISESKLPNIFEGLPQEYISTMQRFANAASLVYAKYPEIKTGLRKTDLNFDPQLLHAWESFEVASAANPDRIWNILNDPQGEYDSEGIEIVQICVEWLEWFISHPAFEAGNAK